MDTRTENLTITPDLVKQVAAGKKSVAYRLHFQQDPSFWEVIDALRL